MVITNEAAAKSSYSPNEILEGWGYLGANKFCRNAAGQYGVNRELTSLYRYLDDCELNPRHLSFTPWRFQEKKPGGISCYWMPLNVSRELRFSNLAELSRNLVESHRAKRLSSTEEGKPNPDLVELDWLADRLLTVTQELHQAKLGLGLTDPTNVIYYYGVDDEPRLELPDLFFVYHGQPPLPLEWQRRQTFSFLWRSNDGENPDLFRLQKQVTTPTSDVRMLAGMFAWLLTNQPSFPDSQARESKVWPILRRAAVAGTGESTAIDDVATLQTQLRIPGQRLSDHFRSPPIVPVVKRRWLGKALAALTLLALLLTGAYYLPGMIPKKERPSPSILCKDCPGDSQISIILREQQEPLNVEFRAEYGYSEGDRVGRPVTDKILEAQFKNLEKQLAVLGQLTGHSGLSPVEQACVRQELGRFESCLGEQWRQVFKLWDEYSPLNQRDRRPRQGEGSTFANPTVPLNRFAELCRGFKKLPGTEKLEPSKWYEECKDELKAQLGIDLP